MPTVLITGANRGIGLEFARQYSSDGWDVVATARPLRVGRNTVVEVDVHDAEGELCARVTQVVTAVGQKAS